MESVQVQGDDHLVDSWSLDVTVVVFSMYVRQFLSWLRLGHRYAPDPGLTIGCL
jgi:hypothetical protein